MKTNIKLYYSRDKADPKKIFNLKVLLKKSALKVDVMAWTCAPQEEVQAVNYLLLTYMSQLIKQQVTIEDLSVPILTWDNPDSSREIRIGYEEIIKEL